MLATILIFSISIDGIWSVEASGQDQGSEVFVIYAASLIKTFEETLGSAFQKESGYIYEGEPRGSVQVANMIIDGLRKPDFFVSAGEFYDISSAIFVTLFRSPVGFIQLANYLTIV